METFFEWYLRQRWARAFLKQIGLSGVDYYLTTRGEESLTQKRNNRFNQSSDDMLRLVSLINKSIKIGSLLQVVYGPGTHEPIFRKDGSLPLTKKDRDRERSIIEKFPSGYSNDPCAAVVTKPNWSDTPLTVRYYDNKYSEIRTLRQRGRYVGIVSANVLLFSEELNAIVVHRRSDSSYDYANTLHTFGGGFIPPGTSQRGDHSGIRHAAIREIFEESDAGIHVPDSTQRIVIDEIKTQFIQLAYLGVNVTEEQVDNMRGNWEGDPIRIRFAELENNLLNLDGWTPTGWVHVLLWLALDTPGATRSIKFGNLTGPDLANGILRKCLAPKFVGSFRAPYP